MALSFNRNKFTRIKPPWHNRISEKIQISHMEWFIRTIGRNVKYGGISRERLKFKLSGADLIHMISACPGGLEQETNRSLSYWGYCSERCLCVCVFVCVPRLRPLPGSNRGLKPPKLANGNPRWSTIDVFNKYHGSY